MLKKNFFDLNINILDSSEALDICTRYLKEDKFNSIFFLNAHCYNISRENIRYKEVLNKCTLLLNDGIGVKLGLRLLGIKQKENMNGTDFIPKVVELGTRLNKNIYLLGGKGDTAKFAGEKLKRMYPSCNIVGWNSGYFGNEINNYIINDILEKKTDILIVGMGVPMQEIWINDNELNLKGVKLCIAGGAILDFLAENVTRAPKTIRRLNLEWAYRLMLEPRRLWKRYILGNFKYIFYIIFGKIKMIILD